MAEQPLSAPICSLIDAISLHLVEEYLTAQAAQDMDFAGDCSNPAPLPPFGVAA